MTTTNSFTPEEVAELLKIKKNTVYELIKRGELSAYRIGRKLRIESDDIERYIQRGKGVQVEPVVQPAPRTPVPSQQESAPVKPHQYAQPAMQGFVICGQDTILDVLGRHLERHPRGTRALRLYAGSFEGLLALYHEKVQMASAHLWDGETGGYNIPYVKRLLPGIPSVIIHLAKRMQGFYVKKGNPQQIKDWNDLLRQDLVFINREKGSGTRVLLDENIRLLHFDRKQINGYSQEEYSHLAVASAVARGEADFALGNEKAALQAHGVDFIPLHQENYDLVCMQEDLNSPTIQAVLDILRSQEFRREIEGFGGYDLSDIGKIVTAQ